MVILRGNLVFQGCDRYSTEPGSHSGVKGHDPTTKVNVRLHTLISKAENWPRRLALAILASCLGLALGCAGTAPKEEFAQDLMVPKATPTASERTVPVLDSPNLSGVLAEADKPVAQADTTEEEGEEKEYTRDYSLLLEDPSKLGFEPDDALFRNVYYYIKKSFVEEVPSNQLFVGVQNEVRDLLKQADIPADGVDTLDPERKVLPQILDRYGDKVDKHLLTFSAILGMLDGLEDRYSLLMLPEDYAKLQEQMQAKEFGGIGIYIELDREDENRLTVFEPI